MQAKKNILTANQISKTFIKGSKHIAVLRSVSLTVAEASTVSIVGASGAGKSTLLHILGTLESPDEGTVVFDGIDLATLSPAALSEFRNQKLGFVFQFHHLLPELSAVENVALPALIAGKSQSEANALAEQALSDVHLRQRLSHKPGELSGGEQQRVALARALVLKPPLLLADEVTGNLDVKTGEEILDLLFDLNQVHNTTLVLVTHNQKLAARTDSCFVLVSGALQSNLK